MVIWLPSGQCRYRPRGSRPAIIRMCSGSIVSCCAPMTRVGTWIEASSAVRSQCARLASGLMPSSLGPCMDLLHLVHEPIQVPQRRLVRLIAEPGAELVVVVILDPGGGQVAVARLEVLMCRSRPAVQQQYPKIGPIADALDPDREPARGRVHWDLPGAAAQHVVPAGVVQVIVHKRMIPPGAPVDPGGIMSARLPAAQHQIILGGQARAIGTRGQGRGSRD